MKRSQRKQRTTGTAKGYKALVRDANKYSREINALRDENKRLKQLTDSLSKRMRA